MLIGEMCPSPMHEVSIANNLVEIASQKAKEADSERVSTVHMKVGVLSCVVPESLEFAFDIAAENTMLDGATLKIQDVPAVVFCPDCQDEKQLPSSVPRYETGCPDCGTLATEIRQGQEVEVTALKIH